MELTPKSILMVVSILLLSHVAVLAQRLDSIQVASDSEKAEVVASRLQRELMLTNKQTKQVRKIAAARFKDIRKAKNSKTLQQEQIDKACCKKLEAVLTKEQYIRYQKLCQETRHVKEEHARRNPGYIVSDEDKELDF